MTNTAEQGLTQRVIEYLRRDSNNIIDADTLYFNLGGEKVTGLSENEFKTFLENNGSKFVQVESKGDENQSPRYALNDTLRRKRTHVSKGRSSGSSLSTSNTPGKYVVQRDGLKAFLHAAKRVAEQSSTKTIAWNELRNCYRKDTGRHLTVDELNDMLGTKDMTKNQILFTKFSGFLEPVDNKALILRLVDFRKFSSPQPARSVSASSPPNSQNSSPIHNCSPDAPVRSRSEDLASVHSTQYGSVSSELKYDATSCDSYQTTLENSTEEIKQEVEVCKTPEKNMSIFVEMGDDDVFVAAAPHGDISLETDMHFENDEATVSKFAESLIQHRNSLPDEYGEEIYGTSEQPDSINLNKSEQDDDIDKSQVEDSSIIINEQASVSNGINLASIAEDSIRSSFCTPMDNSTNLETSGEQGYLTCTDQVDNSDASVDVSLDLSCAGSVDPPTPRRTHEITLCSSRIGNIADMPQPDVSPLCAANHEFDSPISNAIEKNTEGFFAEPIPLPRTILVHNAELGNNNSYKKLDISEDEEVLGSSEKETVTINASLIAEKEYAMKASVLQKAEQENLSSFSSSSDADQLASVSESVVTVVEQQLSSEENTEKVTAEVESSLRKLADIANDSLDAIRKKNAVDEDDDLITQDDISDDIPYDNDETSTDSSPIKTVTVEVELQPSPSQIAMASLDNNVHNQLYANTDDFILKKEIPESVPEDESMSPVDDDPSRDPSIISEVEEDKRRMLASEKPSDVDDDIQVISPEPEFPGQELLVGNQTEEQSETSSKPKKNKKRVRLVAPRRRLFNCCSVL